MVRFLFLTAWFFCVNNRIQTTVYRKRTYTGSFLDESSYNPTSHKATTIRTLPRRALLVCDSHDSLADEHKYLDNVFSTNNHSCDFVTRNTYPTEPNPTNTNMTLTTTVTIPYNKGNSEIIARILRPYNILVAHRPITTLQKLLTKDRQRPNAATARPLISARPAEIWTLHWLNTEEWRGTVTSTITLLNTIYRQTTESTVTLLYVLPTALTTTNGSYWKAGLLT